MADAFGENVIKLSTSEVWVNRTIQIGHAGENDFRTIQIDVSNWLTKYPDSIFSIVYKRPDGQIYPVEITTNNNIVSWNISDTDVSVSGMGYIELRLLLGDMVGKTSKINTLIKDSLFANSTPTPPKPDWVDEVIQSDVSALHNANQSQSYAVGGTGTRANEDTDNSKYYKEQSANILADIISNTENFTLAGKLNEDMLIVKSDILDIESNISTIGTTASNAYDLAVILDGEKVDNNRVLTDVPVNAVFTDTITTINGESGDVIIGATDIGAEAIGSVEVHNGDTNAHSALFDGKQDKPIIKTIVDMLLVVNTQYYLGELAELDLVLPNDVVNGQTVIVVFSSGATPCALSVNLTGFTFVPKANKTNKLTFTAYNSNWMVETEEN